MIGYAECRPVVLRARLYLHEMTYRMRVLCLLAGVLLLDVSPLCAEDNDAQIKKIVVDVQTAYEAQKTAGSPPREARAEGVGRLLAQLLEEGGTEDTAGRESVLTQLAYLVEAGPVRQECLDLAATLHGARDASEQKTVSDINAAIDRAPAVIRTARTAPELDDLVRELGKYRPDRGAMMFSRLVMSAASRARITLGFVTQWQDYLSELSAGETERAVQSLQSLSQQEVYLIPRSEILERIHNGGKPSQVTPVETPAPTPEALPASTPIVFIGPPVSQLVAGIKTLDNLTPALDELDKISHNGGDPRQSNAGMALKFLSPLDQSYREFLAGQSTKVELGVPPLPTVGVRYDTSSGDDELSHGVQRTELALRDQLLAVTLPRYLDLPGNVTARPSEGPIDFLDRRKAEALAAGDYLGAAKADEARAYLRSGGNSSGTESTQAAQFIMADRQDVARQYELAVASYEHALATGTNLIPAKVIGDRLDAIKTAHPQEFQQGLDLYLTPAPRGYPGVPFGPYGPYGPNGMMRRGGSPYGQPEPTPLPVLAVPAATPTASPSPK